MSMAWTKFRDPTAGKGETQWPEMVINPDMVLKLTGGGGAKETKLTFVNGDTTVVEGDLDTVTAKLDSEHAHDFPEAATEVSTSGPPR